MPFLPPESNTYINVKLTDAGRRMLSLGQLQFFKAVVSDREIDYNIDRKDSNGLSLYDISNNRVLSPVGDYPNVDPINFDGTQPVQLTNQTIQSVKQFATAQTATYGMFSGSSNNWSLFANPEHYLTKGSRITGGIGTDTITINAYSNPSTYKVKAGDTVFIPWATDDYPQTATVSSTNLMYSGAPFNGMFYSVTSASTNSLILNLDRTTPDISNNATIPVFIYPKNAIETYFGSGSTQQTKFWNMNIVRPYDVAGTDLGVEGVSGYCLVPFAIGSIIFT
jgi:hypothetical protein